MTIWRLLDGDYFATAIRLAGVNVFILLETRAEVEEADKLMASAAESVARLARIWLEALIGRIFL